MTNRWLADWMSVVPLLGEQQGIEVEDNAYRAKVSEEVCFWKCFCFVGMLALSAIPSAAMFQLDITSAWNDMIILAIFCNQSKWKLKEGQNSSSFTELIFYSKISFLLHDYKCTSLKTWQLLNYYFLNKYDFKLIQIKK